MKTVESMATESPHWLIMGKIVYPPFLSCIWSNPFYTYHYNQSSSILGRIRPLILELLALEWRKFNAFELEYLWSQLANLDQILCVAPLGGGCIRFPGRLDQNSCFHGNRKHSLTYNGENDVSTFARFFFIQTFLYLHVTRTCIKSLTSSNFSQIGPLTMELAALEV